MSWIKGVQIVVSSQSVLHVFVQDCKKADLLDGMLAGEMSYFEAERESAELKAVARVKEAMCSEVKLDTWEEIEATLPEFAKIDVLKTFRVQKGKKPPEDFLVSYITINIPIGSCMG